MSDPGELLQTLATAVTGLGIVGGAVGFLLYPRFRELVRSTARAEANSAEAVQHLATGDPPSVELERLEERLDVLDHKVEAVAEGMTWAGRTLDALVHEVDRLRTQLSRRTGRPDDDE